MKILVTGGAGFIGTHVVNKLLTLGHEVVIADHLDPQVHGRDAEIRTDVEYAPIPASSLSLSLLGECEVVIHLGSKVGVGQSMHQIADYVSDNTLDTAHFLSNLTARKPKRLVVASSMSIYGEGPRHYDYTSGKAGNSEEMFEMGLPAPCHEDCPPNLQSIYALTKYDQEQLCLIWGKAYDVPTVALRFFNTYGPGQSLNNPYTGVMAIFASRLLNRKPPVIYEDGLQSRDFIHVDDVANAVVHAALNDIPSGPYNVGTGVATTVKHVADMMAFALERDIAPEITGQHRKGDIRHCFADISKITATGWRPEVKSNFGIYDYCRWLLTQPKPEDKFEAAHRELAEKGLTK